MSKHSTLDVLTWSHQQGEDVGCTCFVLRAVQKAVVVVVVRNAFESTRTMYRALWENRTLGVMDVDGKKERFNVKYTRNRLPSRDSLLRPDWRRVRKRAFGRGVLHAHSKSRNTSEWSFFPRPSFWFKVAEKKKKTLKCTSFRFFHSFHKRPKYHVFRMVIENDPSNFRFPKLLQSGRKSMKPKCSGCFNF